MNKKKETVQNYEVSNLEQDKKVQGNNVKTIVNSPDWNKKTKTDIETTTVDKATRNFKYTTTEPEITLTDITERLGTIDNFVIVNNPINAKISCENNLISIENQGICGLVQMQVSGHNAKEKKSTWTENIFVELNSANEDEWYGAEDVFDEDYYEELNEEELEEVAGGYAASTSTLVPQYNTSIDTIRSFKYTTTEPEICLTGISERLGTIDNIEIINNPINAKITCIDNLISVENQGVYGLVQMEVSGHNVGEAKEARIENVFVEFDSASEDEWYGTEDVSDEEYFEELNDEELENTSGGTIYTRYKTRAGASEYRRSLGRRYNDKVISARKTIYGDRSIIKKAKPYSTYSSHSKRGGIGLKIQTAKRGECKIRIDVKWKSGTKQTYLLYVKSV